MVTVSAKRVTRISSLGGRLYKVAFKATFTLCTSLSQQLPKNGAADGVKFHFTSLLSRKSCNSSRKNSFNNQLAPTKHVPLVLIDKILFLGYLSWTSIGLNSLLRNKQRDNSRAPSEPL